MPETGDAILELIERYREYLPFLNDSASVQAVERAIQELEAELAEHEEREGVIMALLMARTEGKAL